MKERRTIPTLGEILVSLGVPQEVIEKASVDFYASEMFGEYLVKRGIITEDLLYRALAQQAQLKGDIQCAIEYIEKASEVIHLRSLKLIEEFAR